MNPGDKVWWHDRSTVYHVEILPDELPECFNLSVEVRFADEPLFCVTARKSDLFPTEIEALKAAWYWTKQRLELLEADIAKHPKTPA